MLFEKDSNKTDFELTLNNLLIPRVYHTKFLGLWIDDRLNWHVHEEKLLLKLRSWLGMLYKGKNLLTSHLKRIRYFGQIYSNLCYGIGIWGPMVSVIQMNKLIKLQNRCVQQINPTVSLVDTYAMHSLLKLPQIIQLEQIKLGYKLSHNMLPSQVAREMLTDQKSQSIVKTHKYQTRKKTIPNRPNIRCQLYRSSYLYQAPLAFSKSPDRLQATEIYHRSLK